MSKPTLAEFLAGVKARCEKATKGPWLEGGIYPGTAVVIMTDPGCGHPDCAEPPSYEPVAIISNRTKGEPSEIELADRAFIVHARTDALVLLKMVTIMLAHRTADQREHERACESLDISLEALVPEEK